MSKKWTIVTVNYKTEAYLPWKLKMIYENENKDNFHYVIIDNSPVHNKAFFDDLKLQYPDIKVIPFVPKDVGRTSGEHGEGLNVGLEEAKINGSEYLMVYDPDFFWVQKNLLDYMERLIKTENYVAIGAPYTIHIGHGNPNFPVAFGCFYPLKALNGLDFSTSKDPHELLIGGKDVGWKVRAGLSGQKFLTFTQSDVLASERIQQPYSYETILRQYFLNGKRIAYHLHRGSFDDGLGKFQTNNWRGDRSKDLHEPFPEWVAAREAYCKKYYEELKNSKGYA